MTEDPRISEIRAAIEVCDCTASMTVDYLTDTIRAILDRTPPAPRVEWQAAVDRARAEREEATE